MLILQEDRAMATDEQRRGSREGSASSPGGPESAAPQRGISREVSHEDPTSLRASLAEKRPARLAVDYSRLVALAFRRMDMIAIKPHHFVDIVTAVGDGYTEFEPHPYGHVVHSDSEEILGNPDVTLRMELGADDICLPCCHNADGRCDDTIDTSFRPRAPESKGAYSLLIDRRWCERLGLEQGEELTAREFCLRLCDRAV